MLHVSLLMEGVGSPSVCLKSKKWDFVAGVIAMARTGPTNIYNYHNMFALSSRHGRT